MPAGWRRPCDVVRGVCERERWMACCCRTFLMCSSPLHRCTARVMLLTHPGYSTHRYTRGGGGADAAASTDEAEDEAASAAAAAMRPGCMAAGVANVTAHMDAPVAASCWSLSGCIMMGARCEGI